MSYVVFEIETTLILDRRYHATERAAKSALTRAVNKGGYTRDELDIAESSVFSSTIEKFVTKTNLMTGKEYEERVNTPIYCSPSSESYWSM